MTHHIYEPASTALVGDPTPIASYETGKQNEKLFDGQPFSRIVCIASSTDSEQVEIAVRGAIQGLTPQQVQEAARKLVFVRVKLSGVTLSVRGDQFNKVTYSGTAEKAEIVKV